MAAGENGGKGTPRLAIRRNGIDIARLMPGPMDEDKLDVKIVFPQHAFEVYTYRLLHVNPDVLVPDASEGKDITYHHGAGERDVVIHVKNERAVDEGPRYKDLPLKRLLPPNRNTIVPLPLLKIEIPRGFDETCGSSKRKKRKGKVCFDMEPECDVVEVFMTSHEWRFMEMSRMIPDLMGILADTPFEAWASGKIAVNQSKVAVIPHGEPRNRMSSFKCGDIDFLVLQYPQPTMPLPQVLRVTFIENALAEAMMLHMQAMFTRDGQYFMLRCPTFKDICMPDYLRVRNLQHQDVWVRALRSGTITLPQHGALAGRVDEGRVELMNAIRERERELRQEIDRVTQAVNDLSGDERVTYAPDSFERHKALAEMLGSLPVAIHSTRVVCEPRGVDEVYSFLTLGNDIDVHLDIARFCDFLDAPHADIVMATEGRPFEDGLGGMRTALKLRGFRCLPTETSILVPADGVDGRSSVVPLYVQEGLVDGYKTLTQERKEALKAIAGDDLKGFLDGMDDGLPFEPGLHVLDVSTTGELDGHTVHSSVDKGIVDEDRWKALSSSINSFTDSYASFRVAFGSVEAAYQEFMRRCSREQVGRAVREGGEYDAIYIAANQAVEGLAMSMLRFPASLSSFVQEPEDRFWSSDMLGVGQRGRAAQRFISDLALYGVNSDGVFIGIRGTTGVGDWLFCDRGRLLAWDGWVSESRELLECLPSDNVDVESLASEAYAALCAMRDWALLQRAGELLKACQDFISLKEEYGVEGGLLVMRVPEGATTADAIVAEYIDRERLVSALEDLLEVRSRYAAAPSAENQTAEQAAQPLVYDIEGPSFQNEEREDTGRAGEG